MADELTIIDNNSPEKAAEQLKIKRDAAFEKLAKKLESSTLSKQQRKNQKRKIQDGRIAATTVFKYVGFSYALASKGVKLVPMTPKTATQCGLTLFSGAFANSTTNGRLLGVKSVGKQKNKKIKVTYGRQFVDRKASTSGKKTGRTGRSRALSKGLVQKWITVNVPLDATNLDVLAWIRSWKKLPEGVQVGDQYFPIRDAKAIAAR